MNSVAHTNTIFNDTLDTKPRCKGGRPRKQAHEPFVGFTQESISNEYFRVPAIFLGLCAMIDNLAELKVVLYIMRHTWGFREYNAPKRITIDEFVNGRKRVDGTRMDFGTGLSKRAVMQGLQRAIEHGIVSCYVDESDMARVKHFYQLSMQNEEMVSPEPEEDFSVTGDGKIEEQPIEASSDQLVPDYAEQETEDYDPYAGTIFAQQSSPTAGQEQKIFVSEPCTTITTEVNNNYHRGEYQSHRSENRTEEQTLRTKEIRNVHPSENLEEVIRFLPGADQLPKAKAKSPAFILKNALKYSLRGIANTKIVLLDTRIALPPMLHGIKTRIPIEDDYKLQKSSLMKYRSYWILNNNIVKFAFF
jgi:hypothetical protein